MGPVGWLIGLQAVVVSALVYLDARRHRSIAGAAAWAVVTLATGGLAAPAYVLARPSRAPTWGLSEVVALPIFFVVAILPIALVLEAGARRGLVTSFGSIVVVLLVQNAVLAGVSLYVALVKYRLLPASLGLVGGQWGRRFVAGAVASGAALAGNFVGQNLTIFAAGLVVGQQAAADLVIKGEKNTPVFRMLQEFRATKEMAILLALVVVVVPIGEELFFRGLTYGALRRILTRPLAILASAAFFAVAHLQFVEFLPIFILGVILAYLYDFTGSLVPGMIAHAVNNLGALALFYLTRMPSP